MDNVDQRRKRAARLLTLALKADEAGIKSFASLALLASEGLPQVEEMKQRAPLPVEQTQPKKLSRT